MRPLALGLGLSVLLVGARASGDRPERTDRAERAEKTISVPAFSAPESLAIFGPEVARAVAEALGQAGVDVTPTGLRVEGAIEPLDTERVRLVATIGGRSVQADGELEWIDAVAADLATKLANILPATTKRTVAHVAPARVEPAWRKTATGKVPPEKVEPATATLAATVPHADPTPPAASPPAASTPPDLGVVTPAAVVAADRPKPAETIGDPGIGSAPAEVKPPPPATPPDSTTVTVTPPPGTQPAPSPVAAKPPDRPSEPAHTEDPYSPLTPVPPRPIPPPSTPARTPAVASPLPPATPLAQRSPRIVLHTVNTPNGCEGGDLATAAARDVLARSGLTDVVRSGCGITALVSVMNEARRSGASSVVMADIERLQVENAVFGFRAIGRVRIVAVRDGQPVISTSYDLQSRFLTSPDAAHAAAELTQLAFQRLGRTFTALLATR